MILQQRHPVKYQAVRQQKSTRAKAPAHAVSGAGTGDRHKIPPQTAHHILPVRKLQKGAPKVLQHMAWLVGHRLENRQRFDSAASTQIYNHW